MNARRVLCLLCLGLGTGFSLWAAAPLVSTAAANRFLGQASWGPDTTSVARVQQIGFDGWLNEQFAMAQSEFPDPPAGAKGLQTLQQRFFANAIRGQDQLRQRVAFVLSQIWVVSGTKVNQPEAVGPYLRMLSAGAFGNYLDIMRGVTLSPAMGRYLDMVNNDKPNPAAGRSANENYAREFLQLFTLGEALLNLDGAPIRGARGEPVPAYTEATVQNLARAFTGWTFAPPPGAAPKSHNPVNWSAPMVGVAGTHDMGPKTLLDGVTLPAGQSPETDLDAAVENVFNHPNVAPFVCKQLIQHLVTSNPSPAYVARVSAVFVNNGSGVRGDLRQVIRAILLDDEARADDDSPVPAANAGHLREPVLFITGLLRALNATVAETNQLPSYASSMGQNVFYPASVFSYFSPGYKAPGTALGGPEFQIYTAATALSRANFVNSLVFGQVGTGTQIDLAPFITAAQSPDTLVEAVNEAFLHGQMPWEMRRSILTALAAANTNKLKAQTAVYLAASSAWYQVQH